MNSWKWSTGEAYYKSARPEKQQIIDTDNTHYDSKQNAINQSLDDTIFENAEETIFSRNNNSSENRREELDTKISDRHLITQRGVNPFLQQTSYVNDIIARDMFLKPVNTTHEKLKVTHEPE
jgi:FMN phosphatase YigB (HAD superfamily)